MFAFTNVMLLTDENWCGPLGQGSAEQEPEMNSLHGLLPPGFFDFGGEISKALGAW